jgi:cell division protein FtsI (penicillin-binding protein 3)
MSQVSERILKRVYLLFALVILAGVMILVQVVRIQFFQREKWEALMQRDRIYYKTVLANRGSLLAEDGSILATTLPFYRIAMDATILRPDAYPNFEDSLTVLCNGLAKFAGDDEMNARYFRARIMRARAQADRHVYLFPVRRVFNHHEMRQIVSLPILNKGRFKGGLLLETINNRRFYPLGDLARITLGLMKSDSVGWKGLEYSFNRYLRGHDGKVLVQQLSGGVELPLSEDEDLLTRDGYDVQTTLNVNMQDVVTSALERAIAKHQAKGGVAILMEVNTGEIKAMANYPETYNTAVMDQMEPGSTFKTASAMVALEDGVVRPDDEFETGDGRISYYDRSMRDEKPCGTITFAQALEKSSNVAISSVINEQYRHRPEHFVRRLKELGILDQTGCQVRGEPAPYLIKPKDRMWNGATLPWLSIGYNVRLTPLQILAFYNAIANNGKLIQPIIVKNILNRKEVVRTFESTVLNEQICSEKTLGLIRDMLRNVVEKGTAQNIRHASFSIAGKTGTCQKLVNGSYQQVYRASFVGYFPADKPRYSCYVMIDEPKDGNIYGSTVAAPVFREIAERLFAAEFTTGRAMPTPEHTPQLPITRVVSREDLLRIYPVMGLEVPQASQQHGEFVYCRQRNDSLEFIPMRVNRQAVPNVQGMTARNALAVLENLGLRVRLVGHGKVTAQSLPAGTALKRNQFIDLTLQ